MLASRQRPEKNCTRPSDGYSEIRGSACANCLAAGFRNLDGNQRKETLIMTTKKPELNAAKPNYEPTTQEETAIRDNYVQKTAQTAPRKKVLKSGMTEVISPGHPDQPVGRSLLMDALGTTDVDFADGLLRNLTLQGGQIDEAGVKFLVSVIKDAKPKDHLAAMLAAQNGVFHIITMALARQLPLVKTLQEQDSIERALNRCARTFTIQMEALERSRTGGEPQVTVQNVSVSEGGQAIVGNVTQAARETAPDKAAASPPALTDARTAPMPMLDKQERAPVALPRGQKDDEQSST